MAPRADLEAWRAALLELPVVCHDELIRFPENNSALWVVKTCLLRAASMAHRALLFHGKLMRRGSPADDQGVSEYKSRCPG